MRRIMTLVISAAVACGPSIQGDDDDTISGEECRTDGQVRCADKQHQQCRDGHWVVLTECAANEWCIPDLGCADCNPVFGKTCVGDDVYECNSDGTVGDYVETCPFESCSHGSCGDDCAEGTELIYIIDDEYNLVSFDPANGHQFELLGAIDCPAGSSWPSWPDDGPATPFSMSIDRGGRAWVQYTSGEIFWIPITDVTQCARSPYVEGSDGMELFGMGFVADTAGGTAETLYVAGGRADDIENPQNTKFAIIDPGTVQLQTRGSMPSTEYGPELTGTGAAELWGYFPGTDASIVGRVDKGTGSIEQQWSVDGLGDHLGIAWAFAHWGGRYYMFLSTYDQLGYLDTAEVYRFDPDAGNAELVVPDAPYAAWGAGVSTCAPIVVR